MPVPRRVIVAGSGTEAIVSSVYPVGRPETVPMSVATPVVVLIVKIDGAEGMKVSMPSSVDPTEAGASGSVVPRPEPTAVAAPVVVFTS